MADPEHLIGQTRRSLLQAGAAGAVLAIGGGVHAQTLTGGDPNRILVVLELSGGNDGQNTVVPYADDAYYRLRPTIGQRKSAIRVIDDHFGFNGGMTGFERLFKDGKLAIVHGCGYENPSFSHFTSMAYWQTAAPNSGEAYGWVGRLADAMAPSAPPNYLVNISAIQSLAVRAEKHTPIVFSNPDSFTRDAFVQEKAVLTASPQAVPVGNPSQQYLLDLAKSASQSSTLIREAWSSYRSPIDYGFNDLGLRRVAAMIAAKMPARLYYTAYANNAFDTHVVQTDQHQRLLTYTSDAVAGFMQDMQRLGRANDVTLVAFSEFGRRVPENTSQGTDHGAAGPMFVVGGRVKGGHYGQIPSLTALDAGDNLKYTTDFRRVYATLIGGWLGQPGAPAILKGNFDRFEMFA